MIDFEPIAAWQAFDEACTFSDTDPEAAEAMAASAPRELLPPAALAVLDGGPKTAEYWAWLAREVTAGDET